MWTKVRKLEDFTGTGDYEGISDEEWVNLGGEIGQVRFGDLNEETKTKILSGTYGKPENIVKGLGAKTGSILEATKRKVNEINKEKVIRELKGLGGKPPTASLKLDKKTIAGAVTSQMGEASTAAEGALHGAGTALAFGAGGTAAVAPILATTTTAPVAGTAAVAANPYLIAGAALLGAMAGSSKEKATWREQKGQIESDIEKRKQAAMSRMGKSISTAFGRVGDQGRRR